MQHILNLKICLLKFVLLCHTMSFLVNYDCGGWGMGLLWRN